MQEEKNGSPAVAGAELTQVLEEKGSFRKQKEMSASADTLAAYARRPEKERKRKSKPGLLAANMGAEGPHTPIIPTLQKNLTCTIIYGTI